MKAVALDPEAAKQLAAHRGDDAELALRLGVVGGGCAGFQYRLVMDHPSEDDHVFESEGERVLVAAEVLPFVEGSEIGYRDELSGAGFEVRNPNAVSACGCGSSFTCPGIG